MVKRTLFSKSFKRIFIGAFFAVILFGTAAIASSTGTIDPNNVGDYKAAFLDNSVVTDPAINFGKFTTESQYNITVSDTGLDGYAWGSSVGWMVMNCADTTSGCSSTNGNFKVANDGTGLLSGYAWGENTGWINFGPFTDSAISTVKIDPTTGNFEGTQGTAGYAWSQNYGWIVFDCTNASTCVNTDWRPITTSGPSGGGGGSGGGGPSPTENLECIKTGSGPQAAGFYYEVYSNGTSYNTQVPCGGTSPSGGGGGSGGGTPPTCPNGGGGCTIPVHTPTGGGPGGGGSTPPANPTQPTQPPNGGPFVGQPPSAVNGTGGLLAGMLTVGKTVSGIISGFGLLFVGAGAIAMLLLANPSSLAELFLLPFRLWSLLLILFGFKKKNHPWGTVYDSVTKQPIDPAYVMLTDMQGNEVANSITDIDGRYGFSVPAGTYRIVANKTNYEFPSKKLMGKTGDELYNNLYFGETIVVKEEGEVIVKNIPLDQLNFDWNEFAKNQQKRLSYYRRSDIIIARISNFLFWFGFIVAAIALFASHTAYNGIVFLVYVVIFILRHYIPQFKSKGSITEAVTDEPLPFSILHVLSAGTGQEITHKVADRLGNYYCLVPNNAYNIVIDRKNADSGYTKIPVTKPVIVKKGYLKEKFEV